MTSSRVSTCGSAMCSHGYSTLFRRCCSPRVASVRYLLETRTFNDSDDAVGYEPGEAPPADVPLRVVLIPEKKIASSLEPLVFDCEKTIADDGNDGGGDGNDDDGDDADGGVSFWRLFAVTKRPTTQTETPQVNPFFFSGPVLLLLLVPPPLCSFLALPTASAFGSSIDSYRKRDDEEDDDNSAPTQ